MLSRVAAQLFRNSARRAVITPRYTLTALPRQLAGSISVAPVRFYSAGGPPQKEEITKRILEVLKGFEKVDQAKLSATATFTGDLKLDSLDTVEVVLAIEEEFSIEIPDFDADNIKSVGDAVTYIGNRQDAY
ncbi:acyl carrier protein [Ramicandelaber brevisporus]|nr:acyl carrier protein [Ramicandelaber brevisporus]